MRWTFSCDKKIGWFCVVVLLAACAAHSSDANRILAWNLANLFRPDGNLAVARCSMRDNLHAAATNLPLPTFGESTKSGMRFGVGNPLDLLQPRRGFAVAGSPIVPTRR